MDPLFGWFAVKFRIIPVDRAAGARALKALIGRRPEGRSRRAADPDLSRRHEARARCCSRLSAGSGSALSQHRRILRAHGAELRPLLAAPFVTALAGHYHLPVSPRHPPRACPRRFRAVSRTPWKPLPRPCSRKRKAAPVIFPSGSRPASRVSPACRRTPHLIAASVPVAVFRDVWLAVLTLHPSFLDLDLTSPSDNNRS